MRQPFVERGEDEHVRPAHGPLYLGRGQAPGKDDAVAKPKLRGQFRQVRPLGTVTDDFDGDVRQLLRRKQQRLDAFPVRQPADERTRSGSNRPRSSAPRAGPAPRCR